MLKESVQQLQLSYRLMRDERVPLSVKLIPIGILLYLLSPIDLIPDFIPFLGVVDDVAIFFGGLRLFEAFAPDYVVHEHRSALGMEPRKN